MPKLWHPHPSLYVYGRRRQGAITVKGTALCIH